MTTGRTLTENLVDLICAKPVTQGDRDAAALFVLDMVANAVGARVADPALRVGTWATKGGGDAGRQAFILGAFAHTLEMDDLHRTSVTHPGCVVIPAAWAAARNENAGGHRFLEAVLRGYEAVCRIGNTVGPRHYEVWHNTATCGPFGAAVAAGSILGLSNNALVDALGNAGTQASGLWEFLPAGAMSKHLHAGRAAESGLIAAQLAEEGFTGPATILEGEKGFYRALCPDPQPAALLEGADGPWQLLLASMKPWPSCRHTHPAIDAAQALRGAVKLEGVAEVHVETYQAALNVCDRPQPDTDYDAKFSLQHCVAAALTQQAIDFSAFSPDARRDAATLADKVSLSTGAHYEEAYPHTWGASVTVVPTEGEPQTTRRTFAKGDPQNPLGRDDVVAKAAMLMRHGGLDDPEGLIDGILGLAEDARLPSLPLPHLDV